MSDMVASAVPEVNLDQKGGSGAAPTVHMPGAWSDFSKDMAAIAAEQTPTPAQPDQGQPSPAAVTPAPVVPEVSQPQTPESAPAAPVAAAPVPAPEVPEKFRGPDGKLDEGKILKSYRELERAHSQKANALAQTQTTAVQPQNPAPQGQPAIPSNVPFSQFEQQVAQDMMNVAASLGKPMEPAYALAQARISIGLQEAQHKANVNATFVRVNQLEERLQEQDSQSELRNLAKDHPWIISPQAMDALAKIRFEEKPWINQSPTPWADAVEILKGRGNPLTQGQKAQVIPNPTGAQQTAQPLPASPAQKAATPVVLNTPQDVEAYLKTLTPDQEAEFWQRQGLRWDAPKKSIFRAF